MELFLEIHANARLRERTAAYLATRGQLLEDLVLRASGGDSGAADAAASERARLCALFDLSQLRFRERDALVDVFRRRVC